MKMTTEAPIKPGWYWIVSERGYVEIMRVRHSPDGFQCGFWTGGLVGHTTKGDWKFVEGWRRGVDPIPEPEMEN